MSAPGGAAKVLDACRDAKDLPRQGRQQAHGQVPALVPEDLDLGRRPHRLIGDQNLYPGSKDEDIKATMNYIKMMKKYMKELDEKLRNA